MIPGDRHKGQDFLNMMNEQRFAYDFVKLEGDIYRAPVLGDLKESRKMYPGLEELEFRLYSFHSLDSKWLTDCELSLWLTINRVV